MNRPRIPTNGNFLDRDFSLTQEQDYEQNVLPYRRDGYYIETVGFHRQQQFIVRGWNLIARHGNRG